MPAPGNKPRWAVLLWPALWVFGWVAERVHRSLFVDWEDDD